MLLKYGDGGVKAEESKYAAQAILNFHGSLPDAIGVVLYGDRSDEGSRRAVNNGRACVVPVKVRNFCQVPVVVRL